MLFSAFMSKKKIYPYLKMNLSAMVEIEHKWVASFPGACYKMLLHGAIKMPESLWLTKDWK